MTKFNTKKRILKNPIAMQIILQFFGPALICLILQGFVSSFYTGRKIKFLAKKIILSC
jgi:hypothetical protein